MVVARPTVEQVRELSRRIERVLGTDHLNRAELSLLEAQLAALVDDLQACVDAAAHYTGSTTDVRLAGTALLAVKESAQWARMYRKHAPLRQRRERLQMGVEGALGVVSSLGGGELVSAAGRDPSPYRLPG